jgi:regulator of ribonuclease activity A
VPPTTADLYDVHGEALECCDLPWRHYGGVAAFAGPAVTLRSHEDNLQLKQAIAEDGRGRVLVVDAGGTTRVAMLGDNMAAVAASNGWSGFVVHGAVRDVAVLADLPIGVVALGSNPRRSRKDGAGVRDQAVAFGGAVFAPGRVVVVDADGVVVLPQGVTLDRTQD